MKKRKNKISIYMLLSIVYSAILLTISTAYSFLNEDLSINAEASISQNEKDYNIEITQIERTNYNNLYYYNYNIVITYLGKVTTTGWEAYFKVPYTTQVEGCYNANSCTVEEETLTVTNADYNGNLSPSNMSASFNIRIAVDEADYSLIILNVKFKTNSSMIDPSPDPNPDDTDYINIKYEIKNDWGTRQWHVVDIENISEIETITSWKITFNVPNKETMTNASIWGGEYIYDEESNKLIISGPNWNPSLKPKEKAEINLQITPPAPKLISFEGKTATGKTVNLSVE